MKYKVTICDGSEVVVQADTPTDAEYLAQIEQSKYIQKVEPIIEEV